MGLNTINSFKRPRCIRVFALSTYLRNSMYHERSFGCILLVRMYSRTEKKKSKRNNSIFKQDCLKEEKYMENTTSGNPKQKKKTKQPPQIKCPQAVHIQSVPTAPV